MGWKVTGAKFHYEGKETKAMGHGNNVAWACAKCTHPILFEYRQAGYGSIPTNPVVCPCGMRYYLEPKWTQRDKELPTELAAPVMTITVSRF